MAHTGERLLSAAAHALRSDDERRRSVAALLLAAFPTEEAALPLVCRAISLEVSATGTSPSPTLLLLANLFKTQIS